MDLTTPTLIDCVRALVVDLDTGRVVLTGRAGVLPMDAPIAAVLSWGAIGADGASLTIEAGALPDYVAGDWWINRPATLVECAAGDDAAAVGTVLFAGIVAAEPSATDGVWSLRLAPPRRRVRPVPDLGLVTSTDWPTAAEAVVGLPLPEVFGTVEGCPLLAVGLPAATTLAVDAAPGDGQIEVEDGSAFAASGTVWVDGHSYAYSARHDAVLLGVTVAGVHRRGTAAVADGTTTFLAAGHAVTALSALRSEGRPVSGGVIDLAAATVEYAEPPLLVSGSERFTLTAHFDQIAASSTALNGINAIRAVTGTTTQSASALPAPVTAATTGAVIAFARPSDRIIGAAYSVSFGVAVGAQVGWARVRIGHELVWLRDADGSVLYAFNPASFDYDDDSDALPVTVEVEDGGSTDQVTVTITAASRVAALGNLDDSRFATLRSGSNLLFRADQTDTLPDRGPISSAALWVRWFANGATSPPTVTAKFDGRTLGTLSATQLAASTLSRTITVDSVTQGAAALPSQNLAALVSGGTGTLSNVPSVVRQTYPLNLYQIGTSTFWESRVGVRPPPNVLSGSHSATVYFSSGSVSQQLAIYDNVSSINTPDGVFRLVTPPSGGGAEVVSSINVTSAGSSPLVLFGQFFSAASLFAVTKALFVEVEWRIASVTRVDTPATAAPISAQSLSNSGIAVALASNTINFTVPAPPRVVDQLFPLSWVRDWSQLTGQVDLAATAAGIDVCLNQVALIVEYDALTHDRVEALTATVAGRDGNPAAVIERLAAASGQTVEATSTARLSAWCAAAGLVFGRRVAERTDALTLLAYAAEQAGVGLADGGEGLWPVRWADLSPAVTVIEESDLLAPASIDWSDRVETEITLRYREDLAGAGFARVLRADAGSTPACAAGEAAIAETRAVEIDGGWLRDDTAAAAALSAYVGRYARPRRVLTLACPWPVDCPEGSLVEFRPTGADASGGILARVTGRNDESGWPTLTAEEIVR